MEIVKTFKVIPGFPDYQISDDGDVVSTKFGYPRPLKPTLNKAYKSVKLCTDNKAVRYLIHRLVALTFIGPSRLQVNHKNGVKFDNRIENLEYVTGSENVLHAHATGLSKPGTQKLSFEQVQQLRTLKGTMTQPEAGKLFGIKQAQVSNIWNNKVRVHK